MRRRSISLVVAPAIAGAIALASCGGADGIASTPPATAPPPVTTGQSVDSAVAGGAALDRDDGILRIGLLLPQTGDGAEIGIPANNAAEFAIGRINDTAMFNGEPVELVKADEGADADSASAAIDDLIAQGVDAVVGPASSTVTVQVLDQLTGAGVLTCSPTASTAMLDTHPDRNGLFFRTIPSDSGQMAALAYSASREGVSNVVVLYRDDEYGQRLRRAASRALDFYGMNITDEIPLATTAASFDDVIDRVVDDSSESTIVVLSDAEQGIPVMDAIAENVDRLGGDDLPRVLVNEAITAPDPSVYAAWPPELIANWVRYAPVAGISAAPATTPTESIVAGSEPAVSTAPTDPDSIVPEGPYALNTFDCVNLIVLSALIAGTDDPNTIAQRMPQTADRGVPCDAFSSCLEQVDEGREIDYNGINSANVVKPFDDVGDPERTTVMTYIVDPNRLVEIERGTVTAGLG